ncbi:hypothetical protein [Amycolatopsis sp. AA4]|uniref:hypothetical protein n=1 Tax=Amycolatopsis sp. AA4 TaxID=1896961 RepID=UPI001F1D4004|nr:hypothetical protein [Amycolatopsis sp. AA4]
MVGLAGTSVRLRTDAGGEQVVLAGHLMAAADFAVLDGRALPRVEPFGLMESLPADVVADAERWRNHLVEVETGLPHDAAPGTMPRLGYDPRSTTLAERQRTKAAELGVGFRSIERKRGNYNAQGLWGLVDQRAARTFDVAGQADARLLDVLRELIAAETDASTGTRSRLMRRAEKMLEQRHGPGTVPLPGKTAFYALIDRLAVGRHTFGSAVTRRQTANRPTGAFTATAAARPGEQVQIDSTPIDVMVLAADGVPVRADLTIAVDVATRTICAAVLRPVGTKAVDASLLLAKMLVPEPMRPGWADALRMSASRIPHERLLTIDTRMREAAARPTSPGATPAAWSPNPAATPPKTEIARALDALLTRAEHGPDKIGARIVARTRTAAVNRQPEVRAAVQWSRGHLVRAQHRRADRAGPGSPTGSARVIDCWSADRTKPRDQAAFDATRAACGLLGWGVSLCGCQAAAGALAGSGCR